MSNSIRLVKEGGNGRAFVILQEQGIDAHRLEKLFTELSKSTRVLQIEIPRVTTDNWEAVTNEIQTELSNKKLRQTSFVACGDATAIVQNICLRDQKFVRTAILVDAQSRPHPSLLDRIIDRIEQGLPLGLPLRSSVKGFDAKPYLQRIRCPVLLVTSSRASTYQVRQSKLLSQRVPTCWTAQLDAGDESEALARLALDFQQVRAKCPQKNRDQQQERASA